MHSCHSLVSGKQQVINTTLHCRNTYQHITQDFGKIKAPVIISHFVELHAGTKQKAVFNKEK